ncbi:MAG: ribosome small subunit-dependent GTPase A [Salinisphaeraceae bacterium]|nr:ribosome small subunit-dependent GTPase A [Salinisphaeraceae bacterium]
MPAIVRGRRLQAVCGDKVQYSQQTDGTVVIETIEPRRSELLRHDKRKGQRLLAANIDRLLIVIAPEPEPDLTLLDCYLIAAENLNIQASIIFNKTDLLSEQAYKAWRNQLSIYKSLNYPVFWCSTKEHGQEANSMAELKSHLHKQCGVLVGQSGVGKSSLINALIPDHSPRTQSLSEAISAGRHTTTATRLYHLEDRKGQIIDSPGVRDFRLWSLDIDELAKGFREIAPHHGHCRFNDCQHTNEPDCKIRTEVEAGSISRQRYQSYCHLLEQLGLKR